jgi:fructose-1-phosphate kinase PfkB-like protein
MILTLTLNPAVDITLETDRINYDDRSPILSEKQYPGGKGINAAQVVHAYGGQVHAVAPVGGARGHRFAQLVEESGIPVTLIPVEGETRRNVSISDHQGLNLKLDHEGRPLLPDELKQVEKTVCDKLDEAERLLNRTLFSQLHSAAAAKEIQRMGPERVILSLGSQGAITAWEEGLLRALPPALQTGSSIGAGDVLGATCVWALSQGKPFEEAFSWAVAAASAAAAYPGLTFASLVEVEEMRPRVEIRPI